VRRAACVLLTLLVGWTQPAGAAEPTPAGPTPIAAEPAPTEPSDDAPSPDDGKPTIRSRVAAVQGHNAAKRFGTAVVLCDQIKKVAEDTYPEVARIVCGQAYLGLGDKLAALGAKDSGRARWQQAAEVDPSLVDSPEFSERLTTGEPPPGSIPPRLTPKPPVKPTEHRPPPSRALPPLPPLARKPPPAPPLPEPPREPTARDGHTFGMGLGAGFDGLGSVLISLMTESQVAVQVSVGLIYPVIDTRARWYGMNTALTPVVGLGMYTPLDNRDLYALGVAEYDALYELGEAIHVDLGAAWTFGDGFDLFAGVAFVTPLDRDNPDTVLLFPQFAVDLVYYF
jgi:hypothetical protein